MKKLFLILLATFSLSFPVFAQTNNTSTSIADTKKKPPIFRANKEQVTQVQKMLHTTESGKLDTETRTAIKTYQGANGLKTTGTLNRATLEKMRITLTEKQMQIPVSPNSFVGTETSSAGSGALKKSGPIFRANKTQIMEAQKMLKNKSMYGGEETGKLDTATRDGLKKFQTVSGIKVTGTLNKQTLEKMGITLTDKQKAM